MEITTYVMVGGLVALVLLIAFLLFRSHQRNYVSCWRCGTRCKADGMVFLEIANAWTCNECNQLVQIYLKRE